MRDARCEMRDARCEMRDAGRMPACIHRDVCPNHARCDYALGSGNCKATQLKYQQFPVDEFSLEIQGIVIFRFVNEVGKISTWIAHVNSPAKGFANHGTCRARIHANSKAFEHVFVRNIAPNWTCHEKPAFCCWETIGLTLD